MKLARKLTKTLSFVLIMGLLCLMPLTGCGSSAGEPTAKILQFADMDVTTETRTGFFGGRYASFKVTGSVTNNTGKPVNKDNVPAIVWNDKNGHENKVKPSMTQDKLLDGETCDVTYSEELSVDDSSIPELDFSGKVEFSGLDETESKLNEQMQAIAAGFAADDAKKAEEQAAKEQAAKEEAQKKEAAKETLQACKGLYAIKAYNTAKDTGFTIKVLDERGNDVTKTIEGSKKGDAIRKCEVTDVKIEEAGWFSSDTVTFTIAYEDPEAKARREAKEEEERKAAEAKAIEENATVGQRNALSSAKSYLSWTAFSYSGLVGQLEFEGYTHEEATFAADNCGADWNEQAAKCAQSYLEYTSFSRQGLIDQLVFEGFTYEQAEYGVSAVGY